MEITLNINAPELSEAINKLAEAIEKRTEVLDAISKMEPNVESVLKKPKATPVTKAPKEEPAPPKEEPAPPKEEPAPPKEEPAPPKEEPAPPKEEPTYTLVQVREKLAALSRDGKQAQVKALIEKFGASKLSDIKEEDYAALMAEAGGL